MIVAKACNSRIAIMVGNNGNGGFSGNLLILDGKNWSRWCTQMKVLFGFQDVMDIVKVGVQEPVEGSSDAVKAACKEQKKRDYKALYLIHQCVNDENFEKIASATSAKAAWDALEKSYAGDEKIKKVRLQSLRRQYELL